MPDEIAQLLELRGSKGKRRIQEMLAAQGYRAGKLSKESVGKWLGLGPKELVQFLEESRATRAIFLDQYEDIQDALDDFTKALQSRMRSKKKRK